MDNKVWLAQDEITRLGPAAQIAASGELNNSGKNAVWSLTYDPVDETGGLYQINLALYWQQGQRRIKLTRAAYATYSQK